MKAGPGTLPLEFVECSSDLTTTPPDPAAAAAAAPASRLIFSVVDVVAVLIFVIFMLIVAIVYLNLLVAMMTSGYTEVSTQRRNDRWIHRRKVASVCGDFFPKYCSDGC